MTTAVSPPQPAAPAPTAPGPAVAPDRGIVDRLLKNPNAIWMREMRQSARLGRTPWILFSITLTISLLMCSIGGIAAASQASPAVIGEILFQVFFSLAFFVVVIVGPAIAANSIASEREGRTWEAVLLTGLTPKTIARGKFLAAYTTIALYIVVLAPVGALSFLFGGVTATEVVLAFAYLFAIAGLAVAFGLAVSSLMSSMRLAIVLTLILAIMIGVIVYVVVGFTCSFAVHELWPQVPDYHPVWLPIAYTRASFGFEYVLFLLVLPALSLAVPAWFLYEVTVANLTSDTEDRSSGLRRWFAVTTPLLAAACALPCIVVKDETGTMVLAVCGTLLFAFHMTLGAFLFAFEPPGPSRRVRVHWQRSRAGVLRRFFGPGLPKASALLVLLGLFGIVGICAVGVLVIHVNSPMTPAGVHVTPSWTRVAQEQIFCFAIYTAPFYVFIVGLVSWLRARGNSPWITRIIAGALLFLVCAAPWIVAAIGGVIEARGGSDYILIGAPSPFFVKYMMDSVDPMRSSSGAAIELGAACAFGWGLVGLLLASLASVRCTKIVREYDRALAQADAALRAEEEAQAQPPPTAADAPVAAS